MSKNGRNILNGWPRSPKCTSATGEEIILGSGSSFTASTMSPIAHEYKSVSAAGVPWTKAENPDGKKVISNGMARVHRILTDEEIAQGRQPRWTELEVHGRIRNISSALLEMRYLTALFLSNNLLTRIPPEISQLCNLTVLDLSLNKLRSLPSEIGDMISLCHLFLNSNQIRVLPYELGKLFRLQSFALQQNPLSPEISKIYHDVNGDKKLLQHLLDHLAINTAPPPERHWIVVRPSDPEKPIATFTVLCYNVLCDKYATPNLYSYCPQWALNWEYRKQYIIKEICHYDADVITLQEVETEQFRLLFQPKLAPHGYAGIFFPKSRSKTMNEEERKYVDGCAVFWKFNKFELERTELIEFSKVAIEKAQAHENMLNRVMPRDHIALVAVLRIKESIYNNHTGHRLLPNANENVAGSCLVVCTAHIHWDPEFCDVKLIQTMMLVDELHKVIEKIASKYHISTQQVPVLICGDFNSLPDSGVFEFLSKGAIAKDHPDLKNFRDDDCLKWLSSDQEDARNLTHPLRLDSAVDSSQLQYTNYTLDFKGMIDYIFATPQSLARLGILGPLDMNWVNSNKFVGFPQPHVPSDHIPIMAQYAIIPASFQNLIPTISRSPQFALVRKPSGSAVPQSPSHQQIELRKSPSPKQHDQQVSKLYSQFGAQMNFQPPIRACNPSLLNQQESIFDIQTSSAAHTLPFQFPASVRSQQGQPQHGQLRSRGSGLSLRQEQMLPYMTESYASIVGGGIRGMMRSVPTTYMQFMSAPPPNFMDTVAMTGGGNPEISLSSEGTRTDSTAQQQEFRLFGPGPF